MSSGILFHLELHVVLHVMLAQHRVATGPRSDLLHPVLVVSLHLPVVIDLAERGQHGQLGAVDDVGDAAFGFVAVLFLDGLVVLHLALEVAEVLPDLLVGHDGLLVVGLLHFLSQDHVRPIPLLKPRFNLMHDF